MPEIFHELEAPGTVLAYDAAGAARGSQDKEIVMSLLAKDPEARPQSAMELASRLAAVPLASPWTQERAGRWWQYHLPHMIRRITIQAETAALASA